MHDDLGPDDPSVLLQRDSEPLRDQQQILRGQPRHVAPLSPRLFPPLPVADVGATAVGARSIRPGIVPVADLDPAHPIGAKHPTYLSKDRDEVVEERPHVGLLTDLSVPGSAFATRVGDRLLP
jgi:hypothetical protein